MNKSFLLSVLLALNVQATTIELFVDQPITLPPNFTVKVHDLSAPERLAQQYLPKLPPDPEQAKQLAIEFLASNKGREYQSLLKEAHQHKTYLMRYNVQKIPAIVFDEGVAVIYGSTDIEHGLEIYREFLKKSEATNEK